MGRTDLELVAASREGDARAFGQIVERYQRAVCAVSYSGTGDRTLSEDIAQDTFVTAWRQLGALREIERLPAWLCGIARNLARAARKKRGRETALDDREIAGGTTPFDAISDREAEAVIGAALAKLPDTYREPMVLFYCEQQSVAAVARALGISEDATHQRLSRGRQQLAAGVTGLVERTLVGQRPRRDLAAAVVAAVAVLGIGSSQVEASTTATKGTSMMKAGLVAAIALAIGGAGYIATRSHAGPATAIATVGSAGTVAAGPTATRAASPTPGLARTSTTSTMPPAIPGHVTSLGAPVSPECAGAASHIADLAMETMPGVADLSPEQLAAEIKIVAEHFEDKCTAQHWSPAYFACVNAAVSAAGVGVDCASLAPPEDEAPPPRDGFTVVGDSTVPVAPYAGTDFTCGSVAKHVAAMAAPDLAGVPAENRAKVAAGIERARATLPDQIQGSCEQGAWTEAKRRCLLAATTMDTAHKCM